MRNRDRLYLGFERWSTQSRRFTGTSSSSIWQVVWCHYRRRHCSPALMMSNASCLEVRCCYSAVILPVSAHFLLQLGARYNAESIVTGWEHRDHHETGNE